MGRLSAILRSTVDNGVMFFCPGCKEAHRIPVGEGPGPRWAYNDNPESPTFSPSIKVTGIQHDMTDEEQEEYDALWELHKGNREALQASKYGICCHSFVRDGYIQFLDDCTHELKGQTVRLMDWPRKVQFYPDEQD